MKIFRIILLIILFFSLGACMSKKKSTNTPPPPPPPTVSAETNKVEDELKDIKVTKTKSIHIEHSIEVGSTQGESLEQGFGSGHGKLESSHSKNKNTKSSIQPIPAEESGIILYEIPDSMKIGKVSEVFIRISSDKSSVTITENTSNKTQTASIRVSSNMEVELIDPASDAFKIVENNTARQIIENGDTYTEWRWDVTPLKSGMKSLKIVVSIIKDGGTKQKVYVDSVIVKSNPILQTENFFEKYWQWMMSSIVIPFIIWFWKRKKRR